MSIGPIGWVVIGVTVVGVGVGIALYNHYANSADKEKEQAKATKDDKNDNNRDINDLSNPKEWPKNPDDWSPPSGVEEELKARETTNGQHRQWKNKDGKIVRRWDQSGREGGKERGEHWHDEYGNHILPEGIKDN
ncbi:MAG: hypothetical protein P1P64_08665 [Treponemataceae bacterium]